MDLLLVTNILLSMAVALGSYLVVLGVRHRKGSRRLGLVHATLATAGTAALFALIFTGTTDKLNNVAALFLIFALIGGGMVLALSQRGKPPPMAGVVAHAIMGLVAVGLLLFNLLA